MLVRSAAKYLALGLTLGKLDDVSSSVFSRHPKDHTKNYGPRDAQELNRYAYVNNNPLLKTDPTGHCGKSMGDTFRQVMSGECGKKGWKIMTKGKGVGNKVFGGMVAGLSYVGYIAILRQ